MADVQPVGFLDQFGLTGRTGQQGQCNEKEEKMVETHGGGRREAEGGIVVEAVVSRVQHGKDTPHQEIHHTFPSLDQELHQKHTEREDEPAEQPWNAWQEREEEKMGEKGAGT